MFVLTTKSWKNHPQKLLRILKSTFFSLLPWLPKRPRFSSPFYKKLNRFKTRKTKNVTDVASASFGDLASMKKKNRLKQKIKKNQIHPQIHLRLRLHLSTSMTGFEPAIYRFETERVIRYATWTLHVTQSLWGVFQWKKSTFSHLF